MIKGFIKNSKKRCHPEESLFRISSLLNHNKKAGGPEQQHLRTTRCIGFTLIELLVVVLIIGILSAIALPQYQAAVDKTKVMGDLQLARSVKMAEEIYYLENGTYTTNQEDLVLSFAQGTGAFFDVNGSRFQLQQETSGIPWSVYVWNNGIGLLLIVAYDKSGGDMLCYAFANSNRGKRACRSLTGQAEPAVKQNSYWVYRIHL